jgi:hypothetical protein
MAFPESVLTPFYRILKPSAAHELDVRLNALERHPGEFKAPFLVASIVKREGIRETHRKAIRQAVLTPRRRSRSRRTIPPEPVFIGIDAGFVLHDVRRTSHPAAVIRKPIRHAGFGKNGFPLTVA